jgi:enoyl-CoA hydratase/carnithine racemase
VGNAFDATMMAEIHSCWRSLRGNDDVNAVVLTSAGDRAFCTGIDRMAVRVGDLDPDFGIGRRGKTPMHNDDPGGWLPPKTAGDLWKPVIGAVNGMACGGAFYLLAECDLLIAADTATFFDPHVTFGMAAIFESMMMSFRMPLGEVLRMALVGNDERMSAKRAYEIGMVQEVVPAAELAEVAHRVAAGIAAKPTLATQATVRAVWYAADLGYRQALDVGKLLVELGTDDASLAAGQELFNRGGKTPWRLR